MSSKCMRRMLTEVRQPPRCWSRADWLATSRLGLRTMELTIRHFIPGRVRLHVPSLARRRSLAEASLKWLRARDGIRSARINYDCACLIVEYDVTHEALLRAVIGRLRLMSIAELRSLVAPADAGDDRSAPAAADRLDG